MKKLVFLENQRKIAENYPKPIKFFLRIVAILDALFFLNPLSFGTYFAKLFNQKSEEPRIHADDTDNLSCEW